jgi:hypothetical protein
VPKDSLYENTYFLTSNDFKIFLAALADENTGIILNEKETQLFCSKNIFYDV